MPGNHIAEIKNGLLLQKNSQFKILPIYYTRISGTLVLKVILFISLVPCITY